MKTYSRFLLCISPIFFLIITFIAICGTANPAPPGAPAVLTLPAVKLEAFAKLPPPIPLEVMPSIRDSATTVDKAANYKEVVKFLGIKLTQGQKKFLNEHKFLLLPKRAIRIREKDPETWLFHKMGEYDEMLGMFDAVGGGPAAFLRKPENARLVTPDVLLHAFYKYIQNSLEYLEKQELAPLLRRFLQQTQARALEYRAASSGQLVERYEVIAAQLTVPLVFLENVKGPILQDRPQITKPLKNALQLLEKSKNQFSPQAYSRMVQELRSASEVLKPEQPQQAAYGKPDIVESLKIVQSLLRESDAYLREIRGEVRDAHWKASETAQPQKDRYDKAFESLQNALQRLEESQDRFPPQVYSRMLQRLRSASEALRKAQPQESLRIVMNLRKDLRKKDHFIPVELELAFWNLKWAQPREDLYDKLAENLKNALQKLEKSRDQFPPQVYSRMVQELRSASETLKTAQPQEDLRGNALESLKVVLKLLDKSDVCTPIELEIMSAFQGAAETTQPQEALYEKPAESLKSALRLLKKSKDRFSPPVYGRMVQEIRNVYEAKEVTASPLYGQYAKEGEVKTDYTHFTPRGHYAKSSLLRGYFRAMMYLGRNGYFLETPAGISDALLVAYTMASPGPDGQSLLKDWQRLMEITTFYAGLPDDICYPEWRDFVVKVLGTEKFSSAEAVNPETVTKISQHLAELSPPRILSEVIIGESVPQATKEELRARVKAFRIFGQRFSFDGWILNRLSGGAKKAEVRLPSTPSALFVPAALGDKAARKFSAAFLRQDTPPFSEGEIAGFSRVLDRVAADLKKVKEWEWFSSVGAAWLKPLGALTGTYGSGYPLYMQDKLFPEKQLQTFLGSFAELKHVTLLYVKQSFAEAGEGPEEKPPPVPKGFVEPNLAFWGELQRLLAYTKTGFSKYCIFKGELEEFGRITRFEKMVKSYSSLAVKELKGIPLSDEEYEKLRTGGLSFMAQPFVEGAILEEKDRRSALIADIHTDALKGQILYEATGEPYVMLALVGNEGVSRLVIGVAFNHYEFTGPLAKRYADADWQERVYRTPPDVPAKNFWYEGLTVK